MKTINQEQMGLSIIIPVYNTPLPFLKECLESIRNSEIKATYEILIINDGSTDASLLEFLNNYSEKHTKVINKENGGVSSARNTGMKLATGKYFLFLDADDKLLPQINKALLILQKNTNFDLVYCDAQLFGDKNESAKKGRFSKFKLMFIGNIMNTTTLFRREIGEKISFNENLHFAEDWDFWSRIASAGYRYFFLPKPFFLHRVILDGKSLSQQNIEKRSKIYNLIKNQFDTHKEVTLESVNEYILNNFHDSPKNLFKLFLYVFLPKVHSALRRFKILKNDFVID